MTPRSLWSCRLTPGARANGRMSECSIERPGTVRSVRHQRGECNASLRRDRKVLVGGSLRRDRKVLVGGTGQAEERTMAITTGHARLDQPNCGAGGRADSA